MPTYAYTCRGCGHSFDLFRTVSRRNDTAVCPECDFENAEQDEQGRLKARDLVATSPGQVMIPAHFGVTLPTTGLMGNQPHNRSGDWENLKRSHAKWDSGCAGPKSLKGRKVRGQVAG